MTFDDSKSGTLLRGKSYRIREITEEGEGNWLGMVWDGMVQEWTLHGVSTRLYEAPAQILTRTQHICQIKIIWSAAIPLTTNLAIFNYQPA